MKVVSLNVGLPRDVLWHGRPVTTETHRRHGIGAALLRAAEDWARKQGCTEMASDTRLENLLSQRAHASLGFQVAERSILYRKTL